MTLNRIRGKYQLYSSNIFFIIYSINKMKIVFVIQNNKKNIVRTSLMNRFILF